MNKMKLLIVFCIGCCILWLQAGSLGLCAEEGNFIEDGAELLSNPWGIVSIVDLYVGFILFSGWIIFREKSVFRSIIWVFFMMVFGFFTGALYTFIALQTSDEDWQRFWMGNRAPKTSGD